MLSVCLMTQDYQMFFLRTNSFSILISPSIAQSLFFFLPHFYRFHFVIIISLHPSLSLCRSLLFVHLFIWSAVSHVNRTMQTKYEKESFLCYKAEIEKNHTHKHSHTQRIWTRAESAGVSKNDECWLDLHISIGFGSWNDIGTAMFIAFRPSSSIVSRVHVCMVLALTCSSAT